LLLAFSFYLISAIDIRACTDLQDIWNDLGNNYSLATDIDCSNVAFYPIGTYVYPFTGKFNGDGHTIKNLVTVPTAYCGLFGYTQGAVIQLLNLENIKIPNCSYAGGLVGLAFSTVISQIQVQDVSISNVINAGGLAANVGDGTLITDSMVIRAGITNCLELVGGLVGDSKDSTISASFASGYVVSSFGLAGGLVGYMTNGYMTRSYANTSPTCSSCASGGLIGDIINVTITNSYATGSVQGKPSGGLIGTASKLTVTNCYAIGQVSGTIAGGLIGLVNDSVSITTSSYWNVETSTQSNSVGGIAKTTAEMYSQQTYVNWDFYETWNIDEGKSYPWLKI